MIWTACYDVDPQTKQRTLNAWAITNGRGSTIAKSIVAGRVVYQLFHRKKLILTSGHCDPEAIDARNDELRKLKERAEEFPND